jgi:outer membrane receptor protein involved in Fe transport
MKKLFFTRLFSIALLTAGLNARAANELAIQANILQEDDRAYTIVVDGRTESVPADGVVSFDLDEGEYVVQLMADGGEVHRFTFSQGRDQLTDIILKVDDGTTTQSIRSLPAAEVASSSIDIGSLIRGISKEAGAQSANPNIEEVTVVAKVSISSLEETERYSSNVIDTMGEEEMERAGDTNVALSMSRIVGVTIQEGKYANVRGLDGRYVSSTLNGLLMPSTDPMRRDVQLDLFPANIIGAIEIQKSYSADLLGSTTGGSVKIKTKGLPQEKTTEISLGMGYNFDVTGDDVLSYRSSDGDWTGYDSGLRDIPSNVVNATDGGRSLTVCDPSVDPVRCTAPLDAAAYGVQFQDDYNLSQKTAIPDMTASISHGNIVEHTHGEIGYYGTVGYKYSTKDRLDAELNDNAATVGEYARSTQNTNINAYFIGGYQFDGGDEILSKTIYLHNTDDIARREVGIDSEDNGVERVVLEWVEREFIAQHFSGEHAIAVGDEDHILDWNLGYSVTDRYEPDRRTYSYLNGVLATSAFERRWSELEEDSTDLSVDYKIPFSFNADIFAEFKIGGLYTDRSREVELIRFGLQRGDNSDEISFDDTENLEEVLSYFNYVLDRVRLGTNTTDTDSYDADENVSAAYASAMFEFGEDLTVVGGVRQEEFTQNLSYPNEDAASNSLESDETLPSLAITYRFDSQLQLRAGYSNTVSYPGIIERSESLSYDPDTDDPIFGNPDLEVSTIDNIDLRLEHYLTDLETISLAVFYKDIDQPIERAVPDASGSAADGITYRNAESAKLQGVELDFTKYIIDTGNTLAFVSGNVSYIDSEVELDEDSIRLEGDDSIGRDLQGQSPWLANLQLGLDDYQDQQKFTLLINFYDDRIYRVTRGGNNGPEYEKGRVSVDFSYEKTFERLDDSVVLKLKLKNILDDDFEKERNGQIIETYSEGTSLSLGLKYEF